MRIDKARIDFICEKIIEYALYTLVFFLPTSKSMIEVCATVAALAWLFKKVNGFEPRITAPKTTRSLRAALALSLTLLIPSAVSIVSALSTLHMDLSLNTPAPLYIAVLIGIVAFAVLAIVMFSVVSSRYLDPTLKIPLLLFLDTAIITAMFTSMSVNISMGAFFFKTLEYLLIFIITAETINTRGRITNILIALSISALIVGFDGIYQQITGFDFLRHFPLYADVKVSAAFQFSNNLGTYLAAVIPIPIGLVLFKAVDKKYRFILSALSLLLIICLLLSQARGAWLGFILGFLFVSFFSGKKNFLLAVSFLIIFAISAGLFGNVYIKEQIKSFAHLKTDQSTNDRMVMWKTALRMIADRPIMGQGLGTFMHSFEKFKPKSYREIVYAHNCYLQMAAEIGIFGLLAFLWFILSLLRTAYSKLSMQKDIFLKAAAIGIVGGIMAYLVNSFFDNNLYSLPLAALFWALSGLVVARIEAD